MQRRPRTVKHGVIPSTEVPNGLVVASKLWYKEADSIRSESTQRAISVLEGKCPMQFWFGMLAGLLIGWISEWILGRQGGTRQADAETTLYQELHNARQEIERLTAEVSTTEHTAAEHTGAPASRTVSAETNATQADDLTVIKGIGPVFAKRLRAAGIDSYAGIAAASPETLRVAVAANRMVATDEWIVQAKTLL
jgi:predicted flap endonuclease-1-like 5' DNA nuclease